VVERQKVVSSDQTDSDVIAMARADGEACVQVFFIRAGKLIGREYFVLEGTEEEADEEVLAEFVKQFYAQAAFVPQQSAAAQRAGRSADHQPVAEGPQSGARRLRSPSRTRTSTASWSRWPPRTPWRR
jgi:excinuclease UvrABC nuclease subunit